MKTQKNQPVAKTPPSRLALRNAYELVLTRMLPRISSAPQSTCRRVNDEDTIDPKRNHICDR